MKRALTIVYGNILSFAGGTAKSARAPLHVEGRSIRQKSHKATPTNQILYSFVFDPGPTSMDSLSFVFGPGSETPHRRYESSLNPYTSSLPGLFGSNV